MRSDSDDERRLSEPHKSKCRSGSSWWSNDRKSRLGTCSLMESVDAFVEVGGSW